MRHVAIRIYRKRKNPVPRHRPKALVLVADARTAHFFMRDRDDEDSLLTTAIQPLKSYPAVDQYQKHPLPRNIKNPASVQRAVEARIRIRDEERRQFVSRILKKVESMRADFEDLVLIAPPRMIGDMRAQMSAGIQKKIIAEITKDLTRAPLEALALLLGQHSLL